MVHTVDGSRVKRLADHLRSAGWGDAARGLPKFVEQFGLPVSVYDNTVEVSLTPEGTLIAVHNGEMICSEHGLSRRTNQEGAEGIQAVRQFRCPPQLMEQFMVVVNRDHNGNLSEALRAAMRLLIAKGSTP